MRRTSPRRGVILVLLSLQAFACQLSRRDYATIDAWLLCDDCRNRERDAVRAIGGKAVHTLDQALVGPSPRRLANMEAQFRRTYRMSGISALSESAYAAQLRANYVAVYQRRSAISLGDIGGSRALQALRTARDSAGPRGYRADVVRAIEATLAAAESAPFGGTVSPTAAGFGDTVRVARGAGLSWDGDEWAILNGAPFPDSLVVRRIVDSLTFVAVGEPGPYALSITRVGPNQITQVTPFAISSLRYTTHSPVTAPVVAAPFPQTRYLALLAPPGDSTDFYRIEAVAPLAVTATAESPGLTAPSVTWYGCSPPSLATLGPASNLAGAVVSEHGRPAPNATVNVVGTALGATTDSSGRYLLTGVPPAVTGTGFVDVRVGKIGFRTQVHRVQAGASSLRLGLVALSASAATARSQRASGILIPATACRLVKVGVPGSGGARIVRLRLTSP